MFERSSGILLHPTSLPGKYGIGTLGKEAFAFVDFLKKSNQKLWQIFPLGPTGYGDSPYQSFSTFAGNPYLIDFDLLVEENLLSQSDLEGIPFGENPENVDYGAIYNQKYPLLRKVYENYKNTKENKEREELKHLFEEFKAHNQSWLNDFAMYISLKNHFNGLPWNEWPEDIKSRQPEAMEKYYEIIKEEVEYQKFIQFLFFKQWNAVKKYANENGVKIIGDIPIFVAADSSDAWANPEIFLFDEERKPVKVAGVPPDYFSATGQLWGNPLYNWDKLKELNYKWWIDRVRANLSTCDIIRIDHFRGFDEYWAVPYGDKTAENGTWCPGPRIDLFNAIKNELGTLPIIAEDLGAKATVITNKKEIIAGFSFDKDKIKADNVFVGSINDENLNKTIIEKLGSEYKVVEVFEIHFEKDGKKLDSDAERTVKMSVVKNDNAELEVYHIAENNELEKVESSFSEGSIQFKINHFSKFTILERIRVGAKDLESRVQIVTPIKAEYKPENKKEESDSSNKNNSNKTNSDTKENNTKENEQLPKTGLEAEQTVTFALLALGAAITIRKKQKQ